MTESGRSTDASVANLTEARCSLLAVGVESAPRRASPRCVGVVLKKIAMPTNPTLRDRRYPRLAEVIPAYFRLFGRRHVLPASIVSLGAGGAALQTPLVVPVHSTLEEVRFALPPIRQQPGTFIAVSAVVRWAKVEDAGGEHRFLTGVEFLDVEERAFERIRNYVYYRLLGALVQAPARSSRPGLRGGGVVRRLTRAHCRARPRRGSSFPRSAWERADRRPCPTSSTARGRRLPRGAWEPGTRCDFRPEAPARSAGAGRHDPVPRPSVRLTCPAAVCLLASRVPGGRRVASGKAIQARSSVG